MWYGSCPCPSWRWYRRFDPAASGGRIGSAPWPPTLLPSLPCWARSGSSPRGGCICCHCRDLFTMYQRFYGLRELPFELTPNPRFLYLPPRHREALSNLQYGLSSAKAITVLIGEAGTGKTTLLRAALESEPCRQVQAVYLNNPALTPQDFIRL